MMGGIGGMYSLSYTLPIYNLKERLIILRTTVVVLRTNNLSLRLYVLPGLGTPYEDFKTQL